MEQNAQFRQIGFKRSSLSASCLYNAGERSDKREACFDLAWREKSRQSFGTFATKFHKSERSLSRENPRPKNFVPAISFRHVAQQPVYFTRDSCPTHEIADSCQHTTCKVANCGPRRSSSAFRSQATTQGERHEIVHCHICRFRDSGSFRLSLDRKRQSPTPVRCDRRSTADYRQSVGVECATIQ